jgi:hypothetical protein
MSTDPTAACNDPAAAHRGGLHIGPAAAVGCGGWYASSQELQHGLQVTEHHEWPTLEQDGLWWLLSFE